MSKKPRPGSRPAPSVGSPESRKRAPKRVRLSALLVLSFIAVAGVRFSAHAQFRAQVNTVLVRASVRSPQGEWVRGLTREAFQIFENGEPRDLTYFEEPNQPMAVMLVLDLSSSMEGQSSDFAVWAARTLLATLRPEDEVGLVTFADEPRVSATLTAGAADTQAAMSKLPPSKGGTALYDAVRLGYEALTKSQLSRQVCLVLGDGLEHDSLLSFNELEELVASRNVVFSSISWLPAGLHDLFRKKGRYYKEPPLDVNLNPIWTLRRLADLSGGESLFPIDREGLQSELTGIAPRLRQAYLIGFQPDPTNQQKGLRRIEVEVEGPESVEVVHRMAFWLPDPQER